MSVKMQEPSSTRFEVAIPGWYINGHGARCQENFNLSYIDYSTAFFANCPVEKRQSTCTVTSIPVTVPLLSSYRHTTFTVGISMPRILWADCPSSVLGMKSYPHPSHTRDASDAEVGQNNEGRRGEVEVCEAATLAAVSKSYSDTLPFVCWSKI